MIDGLTVPKDKFIQQIIHRLIENGVPDYEINYLVYNATYGKPQPVTDHYIDLKG